MPIKCPGFVIGDLMLPQPKRKSPAGLRGEAEAPVPQHPRPGELVGISNRTVLHDIPRHVLAPGQQVRHRRLGVLEKPLQLGIRGGTQLQAEFERMAGNIAQNPQTVAQRVKALSGIADLIQQGASESDIQTAIDRTTQPSGTAPVSADPLEGRTATGPNGELVIRKGGAWVPR